MSSKLELPSLEIRPIKHALGMIYHVLAQGRHQDVTAIEEIEISPRRRAPRYVLSNGESIVVTDHKNAHLPDGVCGVLRVVEGADPEWLSHRRLNEFQQRVVDGQWRDVKHQIMESWRDAFLFRTEKRRNDGSIEESGLRPPQIGALHAIGSHWSLQRHPATIVMPTGTGKTETMLATLGAFIRGTLLVVVPSRALRDQTARKFLTFGLLPSLGNLPVHVMTPIVGVITHRPKSEDDLDIFDKCNVVVATMTSLAHGDATPLGASIAERVDTLIVDEAHHVPADTWSSFRECFVDRRILQFTATPFRRDGKLVDGRVIYNYPLRKAQEDEYFKKITFQPVYEIDREEGDLAIAAAAVARLREDKSAGFDHLVMARCDTIPRATDIHAMYQRIAPDLNPILVHSGTGDTSEEIVKLKSGQSNVVVCVDMLGEGFDLPELKIAAMHDTHKSLAVLLQFTGRFTRTAGPHVGDATVIANIADQEVSLALERLYSEDADWNYLLSEYSSEAVREHQELVEFLNDSERLDEPVDQDAVEISHHLLHPKFSTVAYEVAAFRPQRFYEAVGRGVHVHRVWLHKTSNTLYFVTMSEPSVGWTRSRELRDRQWDLFVLHYNASQKLLYIHSSDTSSTHEKLAQTVGGKSAKIVSGDTIFRTLGGISRLVFQNIGVRKYGRRNLRYALYTGADVKEALSMTESSGSIKNNLFGSGWENGWPVNIGCSYKGRVWCRGQGAIPEFIEWCEDVGQKLQDESIDTGQIIDNVLIPEEIETLPDVRILSVEWPVELLTQSEERIGLRWGEDELPLSMFEIKTDSVDGPASKLHFTVSSEDVSAGFSLRVGGTEGFLVERCSGPTIVIHVGRLEKRLEEYLSDYPPLVRFVDLSELEGNLIIRPKDVPQMVYPRERFEVWDWSETDVHSESIWDGEMQRDSSIQGRVAEHYIQGQFDLIFDDDASGEAADLVCLKEEEDHIRLALVHCKFTRGQAGGARIDDVVAVCSQAVRSARWKWSFRDLCRHIAGREKRLAKPHRPSRFLRGGIREVNRFVKASRFKEVRTEIVIVQPGLSRDGCTSDQTSVLAAAYTFLKETVAVDLDVICSE